MDTLISIIKSIEFWKITAPVFIAALVWFLNERSKLRWEQFKRKEENYRELLNSLKGFSAQTIDLELQNKFVEELNHCWLYAPDSVIKKAYDFLDLGKDYKSFTNEERKLALGCFVAEIRKDLISRKIIKRTELEGKDFQRINMVSE